jgi:hypothetical protein
LRDAGCRILIGTFTTRYLKSLPLPKRKFKAGNFIVEKHARNLWYRKCAELLRWGDQVSLLCHIHDIVKYKVYLDVPKHAALEVGPEISTRSAPTVSVGRHNDAAATPILGRNLEPISGDGALCRGGSNANRKRKAEEATSSGRAIEPSWGKRVLPWETRKTKDMDGADANNR